VTKRLILNRLLLLLLLVCSSHAATAQDTREHIAGVVVAYGQEIMAHMCFDSICGGSVIVRMDAPRKSQSKYVVIHFSYQDNTNPYPFFTAKKRLHLTVKRMPDYDAPLKQFFGGIVEGTNKEIETTAPIWNLVIGAEKEELPFGEVLPAYWLAKNLTKNIWRV
jgi:hypothetical protein